MDHCITTHLEHVYLTDTFEDEDIYSLL